MDVDGTLHDQLYNYAFYSVDCRQHFSSRPIKITINSFIFGLNVCVDNWSSSAMIFGSFFTLLAEMIMKVRGRGNKGGGGRRAIVPLPTST